MASAIFTLIGGVIGYYLHYLQHRRQMAVKMIEIAVGILAAKPEDNKPLRNWAIDVLAYYSEGEVPLSAEAKDALRNKPLPVVLEAVGIASGSPELGRPWLRSGGATGQSGEKFETPMPPPNNKPDS